MSGPSTERLKSRNAFAIVPFPYSLEELAAISTYACVIVQVHSDQHALLHDLFLSQEEPTIPVEIVITTRNMNGSAFVEHVLKGHDFGTLFNEFVGAGVILNRLEIHGLRLDSWIKQLLHAQGFADVQIAPFGIVAYIQA